jgi:type I restriction enzyme S subunit
MEFVDFKIKEIAKVTAGGDKPKIVSNSYSNETPIPIYSNGMENDGLYGYTNIPKVDADTVTISARGVNVGKVCYRETAFLPIVRLLSLIPNRSVINAKYMYYNLKMMNISGTGSAQPQITVPMISELKMHIHKDLIEQEKIASFLSVLDEKIKNNNRINRNLSEQLKAIFSKMFPTITDNGSNTLEEIISFSNGKKRPDTEGKVSVYGGNGILSYTDKSNAENCVIIGRVGAYCGSLYLSVEPCWISDNAIKAKAKNSNSQMFIYYLLQELALSNRHIGTSQPLLTQGILNAIPFNCPSEEDVISFCKKADDIQKLIDMNTIENKRLSELRDTLLPKLMSGELDVSDLNI